MIEKIGSKDLAVLRAKAQSHDAYHAAAKRMSAKQAEMFQRRAEGDQFATGYLAALKDFALAVMDAGRENEQ